LNADEPRPGGDYVLYWMVANRRTRFNFALQRAVERARELERPLLVLEALRCDYRWASERHHRFILDGMRDNADRFRAAGVPYHAYVEPRPSAGKGLLRALARRACAVVTDDYPAFFIPRMTDAGAKQAGVQVEAVDSNGLLPMGATDRDFPTAYAFRRFLQRTLREHLERFPVADPLSRLDLPPLGSLPASVAKRWPGSSAESLARKSSRLADLPVDHGVGETALLGGERNARKLARRFLDQDLGRYDDRRNDVESDGTSGLSPFLHYGHVSSHEICRELMKRESWSPLDLAETANGSRARWWGVSAPAEAFLDQLVTWRELGFNMCRHRADHDRYESLPEWARTTLEDHLSDEREHLYELDAFEAAETHDPIWNAAQRQLVREGKIHNYLRMLWGKKILEWTRTPLEALETMIELNNKYALDGRDPNSYSGIFWVLGRYDRAWGPERPVYGKIRYMSSQNTRRKLDLKGYLRRFAD
jgi:deoxyribodipyrimidine photo-lyase